MLSQPSDTQLYPSLCMFDVRESSAGTIRELNQRRWTILNIRAGVVALWMSRRNNTGKTTTVSVTHSHYELKREGRAW